MTTAYPLVWPEGWPRTPAQKIVDGKHHFRRPMTRSATPFWTFGVARDLLYEELRKLGACHVVISSNFRIDRNDVPVEGSRRPLDQGIAVYFSLDGEPLVMARDAYTRAEENFRSLTLAIEAMRQLERHGGGVMMKRAFQGFTALAGPKQWWVVLGVSRAATEEEIDRAWRTKAKEAHPDAGGSHAWMSELNEARSRGLKEARAEAPPY